LKLSRRDDMVTRYTSADAVSWTTVGSTSAPTGDALVGFAVTSHDTSGRNTWTFDNVGLWPRAGSTVTGYVSADGSAWTTVDSTTLSISTDALIGLVVTSHDSSVLNTATFDNVSRHRHSQTDAPGVRRTGPLLEDGGRQELQTTVATVVVVPGEEDLTGGQPVLQRYEAFGELGALLENLEPPPGSCSPPWLPL
jgi:hypothetical protein